MTNSSAHEGPVAQEDLVNWVRLVADVQDRDAFKLLFSYFSPRIKAYMMRSGSDEAQAEELTQESMMILWRKAASFDSRQASLTTWVFTIARNKRIDAFRKIRRPEPDPEDPLLLPVAEQMQDDRIQEHQTATALSKALANLPIEQAALLKMAFYEDKPHSEIAEETGLPLGTVKSRLRLAIGKLRRILGDLS